MKAARDLAVYLVGSLGILGFFCVVSLVSHHGTKDFVRAIMGH
jgi:hypothetical protein